MSVDIVIDSKAVAAFFKRWDKQAPRKIKAALKEAGRAVEGDAKRYCPQSPTKSQSDNYSGQSTSRWSPGNAPGTLRNSIRILRQTKEQVEIGVPRNSSANAYANYIHNRKRKDWFFLGPGNQRKEQDEKFLDRALKDNERSIQRLFTEATEGPR